MKEKSPPGGAILANAKRIKELRGRISETVKSRDKGPKLGRHGCGRVRSFIASMTLWRFRAVTRRGWEPFRWDGVGRWNRPGGAGYSGTKRLSSVHFLACP